jgi:glyoxylase-like metal-dependent hydrolase (beta-lactamase superfamily II)
MTNASHRFGPYDVTTLLDGVFEASTDVLIHADGEAARRKLIESWNGDKIRIDVNCFLLQGPVGLSLVDAGTGKAWGAHLGKAHAVLRAMGIEPEQIDRVLLTHIHGDHALGLFDGTAPWLPRAQILIPQADLAFFTDETAGAALPEARRGGFRIAASLLEAYKGRIHAIDSGPVPDLPGVEAVPLPGHTPGQTGYLIEASAGSLFIWADALHLPDLQVADPDAGLAYDLDPRTAAGTRRVLLERAAHEGWRVAGSHVTGMGRIERADGAFRFVRG